MEPFKPNRGPLKLSENMIIENLAKVLDIATETVDSIADVSEDLAHADLPNDWRTWSAEETQAAIGAPLYLHRSAGSSCLGQAARFALHSRVKVHVDFWNMHKRPQRTSVAAMTGSSVCRPSAWS